jgi:hypothetical protein
MRAAGMGGSPPGASLPNKLGDKIRLPGAKPWRYQGG